jgi:hypothetical protein
VNFGLTHADAVKIRHDDGVHFRDETTFDICRRQRQLPTSLRCQAGRSPRHAQNGGSADGSVRMRNLAAKRREITNENFLYLQTNDKFLSF